MPFLAAALAASLASPSSAAAVLVYEGKIAESKTASLDQTGSADGYHAAWYTKEGGDEIWKIDDRVIGTYPAGTTPHELYQRMALNRDGTQLAVVLNVFDQTGNRIGEALYRNNAPGATYDEISDVQFSPDGQHLAYAARRGGTWAWVVDERRGPEFPDKPNDFHFNASGHFAYLARYSDGNHLMLDHQAVQAWPHDDVYLSGDWRVRGFTEAGMVVLNDAKHGPLGNVTDVYIDATGGRWAAKVLKGDQDRVYLNGRDSGGTIGIGKDVHFGPDGAAYWVDDHATDANRLFRNGVPVSPAVPMFEGTPSVGISPSGRHYAFIAEVKDDGPSGGQHYELFLDGKSALRIADAPWVNFPIVFDSERELHWTANVGEGFTVDCVLIDGSTDADSSVCARSVRQRNPSVAE